MNRILIAVLLSAFCSFCFAGYELVTKGGPDSGDEYYLDLSTIKATGVLVRLDSMTSYSKPETSAKGAYFSETKQTEYDCAKGLRRWHQVTMYSKQNGLGRVVASYHSGPKWYPFAKGSIAEELYRTACSSSARKLN